MAFAVGLTVSMPAISLVCVRVESFWKSATPSESVGTVVRPSWSPGEARAEGGVSDGIFERSIAVAALEQASTLLPQPGDGRGWSWITGRAPVTRLDGKLQWHLVATQAPTTCRGGSSADCMPRRAAAVAHVRVLTAHSDHARVLLSWEVYGDRSNKGKLSLELAREAEGWRVVSFTRDD